MTEKDKKEPKKSDGSKDEIREVEGIVGEDTFFDEISAKLEALRSDEVDSEPVDEFVSIELGRDDSDDLLEDFVDEIIAIDLGAEEADDLLEDPDDEIITIDLGTEEEDDLLEDPLGSDSPFPSKEILPADSVKTENAPDRRAEIPAGDGTKAALSGTGNAPRKPAASVRSPQAPEPVSLPPSPLLSKSKKSGREIRLRRGKTFSKTVFVILASLSLPVVAAVVGYLYLFPEKPGQAPVPVTAQNREPASPAVVRKKIIMPQRIDTAPAPRKPPPVEKMAPAAAPAAIEKTSRPAQPGPGIPSVSSRQDMRAEILDFLTRWKGAWEKTAGKDGNMESYIAFYSDAFSTRGLDKNGWWADKKLKNRRKSYIKIHLSDVRISPPDPDGTLTVTFSQDFRSSNYSSRSEKTLVLRQEAGGWKILADQ
jgi:hypothetical protein